MAIYVKLDDKRVDIEDIPMSEYVAIEDATGVGWVALASNPFQVKAAAAVMLIEAAARTIGVDAPVLTPRSVVGAFDLLPTEDSRPELEDGLPAPGPDGLPLEESEPPTD